MCCDVKLATIALGEHRILSTCCSCLVPAVWYHIAMHAVAVHDNFTVTSLTPVLMMMS